MDDLKLFAGSDAHLEILLRTVHMFSDDVRLTFGLDKCAKLSVLRGKLNPTGDVALPAGVKIRELSVGETYKYLGLFEAEGLDCSRSKKLILETYLKRLSLVWRSLLSGPRKVRATNSFCVPILSYGFGLIPWTKKEIAQFDVETRKLMTATCNHHPRSAVERLYLPRNAGGMGLINVENLFFRKVVSIAYHLSTSTDRLVKMCFELDKLLPARSAIIFRAESYCASLSISLDFHHRNVLPLKSMICEKQKNLLLSTLLAKPLHGQFFSFVESNAEVDKCRSFNWLKQHLHSETESTVLAIQDQVIATRVIESKVMHKPIPSLLCRECGTAEETIVHLLAACPSLATTEYFYRHNLVAAVIHWHLMKVYSFPISGRSWCTHKPPPVLETSAAKILWDFGLTTHQKHASNRPDIVLFDYKSHEILFIEISCPADINVSTKEAEKLSKYHLLAHDFHAMYNMPVTIVPVVFGCTGVVSSRCLQFLRKIPGFSLRLFGHLQKAVLLGTTHILRTVAINH